MFKTVQDRHFIWNCAIQAGKELVYSGTVRITALGPDGVWYGIGFGAPSYAMVDLPYAVVVEGTGAISER